MLIGIMIGVLFVLIFGIIGVAMLIKSFQDKKKADESQNWSSTEGKITESYIRRDMGVNGDGIMQILYYPEVRYEYEFMGIEYTGQQISFGANTGYSYQKKTQAILSKYPLGANITVYYNPNAPEDAVLERRVGGKVALIIGILFSLIAICTACFGGLIAILDALNW